LGARKQEGEGKVRAEGDRRRRRRGHKVEDDVNKSSGMGPIKGELNALFELAKVARKSMMREVRDELFLVDGILRKDVLKADVAVIKTFFFFFLTAMKTEDGEGEGKRGRDG